MPINAELDEVAIGMEKLGVLSLLQKNPVKIRSIFIYSVPILFLRWTFCKIYFVFFLLLVDRKKKRCLCIGLIFYKILKVYHHY